MNDTNTQSSNAEGYAVEIRNMHKWYGSFHVLKNINLNVTRGEKIVVCGPSGSGKSTVARMCVGAARTPGARVVKRRAAVLVSGAHVSSTPQALLDNRRLAVQTCNVQRRVAVIARVADGQTAGVKSGRERGDIARFGGCEHLRHRMRRIVRRHPLNHRHHLIVV